MKNNFKKTASKVIEGVTSNPVLLWGSCVGIFIILYQHHQAKR
jgi:hypothetical protein